VKKANQATLLLVALLGLTACGGGSSNETQNDVKQDQSNTQPQKKEITIVGSVEKGPFVIGSTVTINILNENGENTDSTIVTKTTDDLGNFEFKVPAGSIIEISASGYYRNEITGGLSEGELTLRSIYKVSETERQNANVNLLTHLTSNRVLELIKAGESSFEQAIQQAEQEFTTNFKNVISSSNNANFASLSIYKDENAEASAYLLALSSMFYQHAINTAKNNQTSPDAELTAALNELESDFGTDGKVDNQDVLTAIKETQKLIDPSQVQQNLFDWVTGKEQYAVPDINEFLDTDLDGIANNKDNDDDNDGIADEDDSSPHLADFIVEDKNISVLEDESIKLDLTTNAPLGDEVKIIATQVKGPTYGELSGYFPEITYTPFNDFNGEDKFTLTLFQDGIESKPFTINVDVKAVNDAPTIDGQPEVDIIANNEYSFSPSISDIEDSQLTVSVENLPEWLTLDSSTGMLQGTPTNAQVATYSNIQMSVSDGTTTSQLPAFSINVDYSTLEAPLKLQSKVSQVDKLQEIQLSWEKVKFAKNYVVEVSLFEDFRELLLAETIESNSFSLIQKPGKYYWRISTANPNEQVGSSSTIEEVNAGVFTAIIGGNNTDLATDIKPSIDDGYIVLGSTKSKDLNSKVDNNGDDWIIKLDKHGKKLWEYFYTNEGEKRLSSIIELQDGSIIAIGMNPILNQGVIVKINSIGKEEWQYTHQTEDNRSNYFSSHAFANEKLYLSVNYFGSSSNSTDPRFTLHTLNLDTKELSKPISLPKIEGQNLTSISSMFENHEGHLIISGDIIHEDSDPTFDYGGVFLMALNENMQPTLKWHNSGEFTHLNVDHAIQLADLNYAILGQATFTGASLAIITPEGEEIENSVLTQEISFYDYGTKSFGKDSENFYYGVFQVNNDYNLQHIVKFNNDLQPETISPLGGSNLNYHYSAKGMLLNKDDTLTILMNRANKETKQTDIVIQRLKF
jgi:hypothetical protein